MHVHELPDQPKGPFEDTDREGVRFWLDDRQLAKIAAFAGERSVELEWRGAGYYMARVYDPNTREVTAEKLIFAQET